MNRLVLFVASLAFLSPRSEADWSSFLGGLSRSESVSANVPLTWSAETGVAWETPLPGHGQSSPVVHGDLIYVTAVEGEMKQTNIVTAYELATGKQLWRHDSKTSLQAKNDVYTSRAAPTPVADAAGVVAFFESGNLIALDKDGRVRWQRDLISDYGNFDAKFGLGGSPAILENRVFVLAENDGPAYLLALNAATGETIWKAGRDSRTAWSSPMLVQIDGQPQLVVSSAGSVDGYDVESGDRLWQFQDIGGNTVASPIDAGKGSFLIGASPGRNGENSEGAKQSNLLMRVTRTEDGFAPTVVWRNEQASSSFGSPIVHAGHAYYTNRAGVLFCLDLASGETAFTARLDDGNWATPVGIGDRVYIFGKSGLTTVLATGPEKEILAQNKLWEPVGDGGPGGFAGEIQYGFAVVPDGFIVRTGDRLFRLGSR